MGTSYIPEHVVIAGVSLQGVLVACQLRRQYPARDMRITLVGSTEGVQGSHVYLIDNRLDDLLALLEVDKASWFATSSANYHLRTGYHGWQQQPFYLAADSDLDRYHQPLLQDMSILRRQQTQIALQPDEYFFANILTEQNRQPVADPFPFKLAFQYQFDGDALYRRILEALPKKSIHVIDQAIAEINVNDSGFITNLRTSDHTLTADLFLDCSGREKILTAQIDEFEIQPKRKVRHNNKVLCTQVNHSTRKQESEIIAMPNGFVNQYNLSDKTVFYHSFSDKFDALDKVKHDFQALILNKTGHKVVSLDSRDIEHYQMKESWVANCIALGESYYAEDTLLNHNLNPLLSMTERLIEAISMAQQDSQFISTFNQDVARYPATHFGFSMLCYLFNGRRNSPYWAIAEDRDLVPSEVSLILSDWFECKYLPYQQIPDFSASYWYCLFLGLKMLPPATQTQPDNLQLEDELAHMRQLMSGCAQNFPVQQQGAEQ